MDQEMESIRQQATVSFSDVAWEQFINSTDERVMVGPEDEFYVNLRGRVASLQLDAKIAVDTLPVGQGQVFESDGQFYKATLDDGGQITIGQASKAEVDSYRWALSYPMAEAVAQWSAGKIVVEDDANLAPSRFVPSPGTPQISL